MTCVAMKSLYFKRSLVGLFRRSLKSRQNCRCYCSQAVENENSKTTKVETSQPGLLETWFYGVKQFGRVNISVPFNLQIESLDPQKYPDMGKLLVKLSYTSESADEQYKNMSLAALTKLYDFNIDTSDSSNIKVDANFNTMATFPALCTVQMPINFDLKVECTGNTTSIKNLETNEITIFTKKSSCSLHNIKGEDVTVNNTDGDITCTKVVQGNLKMTVSGKGNITTERIQGQRVHCCVDEGNISCSSVYSSSSKFICTNGNINLKNNHGSSEATVNNGNLVIDSLDGSLTSHVKNGSTDLFISRPDEVNVETDNGDIIIKLPETSVALDLEGNKVTLDDKLNVTDEKREATGDRQKVQGHLSGTDGRIKATTKNGSITVKSLDWMESLKLKGFDVQ